MTAGEIIPYLGLPWVFGERDCWCFFRELSAKYYGRDVPEVDVDLHNLRDIMAKIDHEKKARWKQIEKPVDGCAVLMARRQMPVHIGMWLENDGGKVLHCAQGMGVVFQDLQALRFDGWGTFTFWDLKD